MNRSRCGANVGSLRCSLCSRNLPPSQFGAVNLNGRYIQWLLPRFWIGAGTGRRLSEGSQDTMRFNCCSRTRLISKVHRAGLAASDLARGASCPISILIMHYWRYSRAVLRGQRATGATRDKTSTHHLTCTSPLARSLSSCWSVGIYLVGPHQ